MKLIAATQNAGKLIELGEIVSKYGIELISMADAGLGALDIDETGSTFEENSLIKAKTVSRLLGQAAIADDSGMCVDYLDGAPGVYSARYGGGHGDDAANRARVLKELEGVPMEKRTASFHCCITIYYPDGRSVCAEGVCKGYISLEEKGTGGFGYDKIFVPEGYAESFAELGTDVKNQISHRAKALKQLEELLK